MKRDDLQHLVDPTVELIGAYKFSSRPIQHEGKHKKADDWAESCDGVGGFNPVTRELTPLEFASSGMSMYEALDHLTAAVEAGVVDKNRWAEQLFASKKELEGFFDELEGYDECYRITDRWWTALASLAGRREEEGFVTCSEIVDGLRESIAAGARRRKVLKARTEYFAKLPLRPLKMTGAQERALYAHNTDVRREAYQAGAEHDLTTDFGFTQPFFFMKGKRLAARQVTGEDLARLSASSAAASKSSRGAKGSKAGKSSA